MKLFFGARQIAVAIAGSAVALLLLPAYHVLQQRSTTTTRRIRPLLIDWENLTIQEREEFVFVQESIHNNSTHQKQVYSHLWKEYSDLGITSSSSFHPVVLFPQVKTTAKYKHKLLPFYRVLNLTLTRMPQKEEEQWFPFSVGKYNEARFHLYETDLFATGSSPRIVHMGIDLGAPVGTPVFAFTDGIVLHSGYNPAKGDYGNAIVVEHWIHRKRKLWALCGHLSNASIVHSYVGKHIQRGEIVGWIGNVHENGGWLPHVHFQLSISPPDTHDMAGVVSLEDRDMALKQYPDPRIVLGVLY
eukprot:CAMPEP_0172424902 /NCGR_PEP_ID=MMETSP1064-20121228/28749_1 /TAXON_ID=202472 /ORGANISM="Aulacoseira subarctica , Strain CCAP 1002/5" /LENGTH=300 /DNA_ID=CAMNT_0013167341 /DNA_START=59 /DNA_END=961 /DNA_ORIENTATION=+